MTEKAKIFLTWILVIAGIIIAANWFSKDNEMTKSTENNLESSISAPISRQVYYDNNTSLDRDEAIEDNWEDIKEYVSGTETIEACRIGGNCYGLDADIYSGYVDTIYFSNGGHLDIGAEIDENGYASEWDVNRDEWEFNLDMNSSIVDDAVEEWAEDNDYELDY